MPDGPSGAIIASSSPTPRSRTGSRPGGKKAARRVETEHLDWALKDFYPTGDIPSGVFLTGYGGDASDLPPEALQAFLDDVAAGRATMPIAKTYALDQIVEAHADMEHNRVAGKLVVDLSA